MRGDTPLTSRLLKPVLLDGETGIVRDLPVYLKALLVAAAAPWRLWRHAAEDHLGAAHVLTIVVIKQRALLCRQTPQAPSNAIAGQPLLQPSE
jgi:hypothetical protein